MARYSPRERPAAIAENPSTGCSGSGKVTPLTVPGPGMTKAPAAGPPANVMAGRTARPTSLGRWGEELAGPDWRRAAIMAGRVRARAVRVTRDRRLAGARGVPMFMTVPLETGRSGLLHARSARLPRASGERPGSARDGAS